MSGCARKVTEADPEFSDAARYLFTTFDGDEADLAFAMRALEEQIYLGMDVDSDDVNDRALLPEFLEPGDVVGLNDAGRDLDAALPVAVAGLSAFELSAHPQIQLLEDHTPVEPFSPEYYERTFTEGGDCWGDQSCGLVRTHNTLVKENTLMTVNTEFYKDFRWVDLGEEGASRMAYVARSWQDQSWPGRNENTWIHQSYTIEVWIPRDGGGFVRDGTVQNVDGGEWTGDSTGGGTLRMLTLWAETDLGFSVSDDLTIATTRNGIDTNFEAAETWLEHQ